jgi:hypothetical protein
MKSSRAAHRPDVGLAIRAFLWFGLATTFAAAAIAAAHIVFPRIQ